MESNDILDSDFQLDNDNTGIPIDLISSNKFIILYIFSLGLYGNWWMYKMWKFYKEREGSDIMPVARAIFGIFFLFRLYEKIKRYAKKEGYEHDYSSESLFAAYLITAFSNRLPDPLWLASFLGLFCFIQPINAFNFSITQSEMYNGILKDGFNSRQIVIIVIGILFWLLVIAGYLLPE